MDTPNVMGLIREIFAAVPISLVVTDSRGKILLMNQEAETLFGYTPGALVGKSIETLVPESRRAEHAERRRTYLTSPETRPMGCSRELFAQRADGTLLPVEIALKPLQTEQGLVVLGVAVDISTRKELERNYREQKVELEVQVLRRTAELNHRNDELLALLKSLEEARTQLERLSREDPLTGLMNRREFDDRARSELRRAGRRGSSTCIAMFDLDRFKSINDRYSHATGDDVLRRVGAILRSHCRSDDLVARYGGEEFAMVLPETGLHDAATICERIRQEMERHPWNELQPKLTVTISAGVTERLPDESEESALARADALLYQAKRRGRNCVQSAASEDCTLTKAAQQSGTDPGQSHGA